MSGKQLVKLLEKQGWELDRVSSSHHIMKRGNETLSVPVHGNRDLPTGLAHKLLKEAGLL
jgi:predicted RNA binding protein YcfA (HicA-like mRNA interferase family)